MTKQDLQQELLEKIKPGTKPSQLKRSKSAGDIPKVSSLPTALTRSKSSNETFSDPKYPYTTLISQSQEIEKLQSESQTKSTTISLLRKKNEELEKALNQTNSSSELSSQFDQNLFARHQNLKDWFSQYQRTKQLDKELVENIEQVSTELVAQDKQISSLRLENSKLKQTNQSLQRDLTLVQKLAESRKVPYFENEFGLSYFKYGIYALLAVGFLLVLMRKREVEHD